MCPPYLEKEHSDLLELFSLRHFTRFELFDDCLWQHRLQQQSRALRLPRQQLTLMLQHDFRYMIFTHASLRVIFDDPLDEEVHKQNCPRLKRLRYSGNVLAGIIKHGFPMVGLGMNRRQ